MERFYTAKQLSKETGFPYAEILAACKRMSDTLPHVETGKDRKVYRIRLSVFEQWIEDEERRCAGL